MGKIVMSDNVSLDGVIQDPAGDEGFRRGGWVGLIKDLPELNKLALPRAIVYGPRRRTRAPDVLCGRLARAERCSCSGARAAATPTCPIRGSTAGIPGYVGCVGSPSAKGAIV
jgi:hypothetical protein